MMFNSILPINVKIRCRSGHSQVIRLTQTTSDLQCCLYMSGDCSLRRHFEVLTKLKLLKAFIWCKAADKPRIGCKLDPNNGDLLIVVFLDALESVEIIRIDKIPTIQIDLTTANINVNEGLTTCTFKINFQDDLSSYMWHVSHAQDDPVPLSSLSNLSCSVCSQPILNNPSKIEKFVQIVISPSFNMKIRFTYPLFV
jgi:hypothetical protein